MFYIVLLCCKINAQMHQVCWLLYSAYRNSVFFADHSYATSNINECSYQCLLDCKTRGGLSSPRKAVYTTVSCAEKCWRVYISENRDLAKSNLRLHLILSTERAIYIDQPRNLFPCSPSHADFSLGETSHETQIVRTILEKFFDIRLKQLCKQLKSQASKGQVNSRSVLNRLTIFRHQ
jgi:hypothetical protein